MRVPANLVKFAIGLLGFAFAQLQSVQAQSNTQDLHITVQQGDQVGYLAQRYLRAPTQMLHWREVIKYNGLSDKGLIKPGQQIKLPAHLLASYAKEAHWVSLFGEVAVSTDQANTQWSAAQLGISVQEGARLRTGATGSAVLSLADNTQVKLAPNTVVALSEHRYYRGRNDEYQNAIASQKMPSSFFASSMRLIQGSIESLVTPAKDRAQNLRIQTPTALTGVRGTHFRVSYEEGIKQTPAITRSEVLSGEVNAQLDAQRQATVGAGFGVALNPTQREVPKPVALLPAPDLKTWQQTYELPTITLPALTAGTNATNSATAYRVQVTTESDVQWQTVLREYKVDAGQALRIAGLEDGKWRVRARAADAHGIEGFDAQTVLTLKARPEPPLLSKPSNSAKVLAEQPVTLAWVAYANALGYKVEIKPDAGVAQTYTSTKSNLDLTLPVGHYSWRIATQVIDKNGQTDTGPWSDSRIFSLIANPPAAQIESDDSLPRGSIKLKWPDQGAASYELQVSLSEKFASLVDKPLQTIKSAKPEALIEKLESGTKQYLRYRAIEADGFVGGWSATMTVDIPKDYRPLWLMPLLLLL